MVKKIMIDSMLRSCVWLLIQVWKSMLDEEKAVGKKVIIILWKSIHDMAGQILSTHN